MKKLLVLGGSYFLGKSFVNMAKAEYEITVFNRGNRPLNLEGVREVRGDRHNPEDVAGLGGEEIDIVVDFCAYEKGDIESILTALRRTPEQYIFISTVDVYRHGEMKPLDENAAFEDREIPGEIGAYIAGKISLENELRVCSEKRGIHYTSIRPAILYGPDNYAPREGIYFHWIREAKQILHPIGATGEFQLVFVEDVARMILMSLGNEKAFDQAFNLAPTSTETYDSFARALHGAVDEEFAEVAIPMELVMEKNIPLPFPLWKEESNWYQGEKALQLIGSYTSLQEGLKKIGKEQGNQT